MTRQAPHDPQALDAFVRNGLVTATKRQKRHYTPPPPPPHVKDFIGRRFTRLVVVAAAEPHPKSRHRRWLCRCDCGNEKTVYEHNLMHGNTTSCGCYWLERRRARGRFPETLQTARHVAQLVDDGLTHRQIAARLGYSRRHIQELARIAREEAQP